MPLLLMNNTNPNLGPPKLAHLLASDYTKYHYLSEELFKTYFKFSFVRHPLDRVYSLYKFLGYAELMNFDSFINKVLKDDLWGKRYWFVRPQYDFIYDAEGKCLIDFIGKLENLNSDFEQVAAHLSLDEKILPHVNVSNSEFGMTTKLNLIRQDWIFLRSFLPSYHSREKNLSQESKAIVMDLYKNDFEKFNY
jgi:hypothetical protein